MNMARAWHRTETRKFFPYTTVNGFFDGCHLIIDCIAEPPSESSKYLPPDRIRGIRALGLGLRVNPSAALTELNLPADAVMLSVILRSSQQKRFECLRVFTLADEWEDELDLTPHDLRRFPLADGVELALSLLAKSPNSEPRIVSRRSFYVRPEVSAYEFPHRIAEDQDFEALGLPGKTPWFVRISEGVEFSHPTSEIVTLLIHKTFKSALDRLDTTGASEGVMRLMLADTMRSLAVTFAQEDIVDTQLPDGSLGQRLTNLCADAGVGLHELVGEQGPYHQQRLVAWVHERIRTIDGFRRRGGE